MTQIYVTDEVDQVYRIDSASYKTIADLTSGFQQGDGLSLHYSNGTAIPSDTLLVNLTETKLLLKNEANRLPDLYGVKLTPADQEVLVRDFAHYLDSIKGCRLSNSFVLGLTCRIKATLGEETIGQVMTDHGLTFGTVLGTGRRSSVLKVVHLATGKVSCAKLFPDFVPTFADVYSMFEFKRSETLKPHRNIVEMTEMIRFTRQSGLRMIALLMPLYYWSLREILHAIKIVPFHMFVGIAFGLLNGASRFVEKGLCHCDIKPSNVMMDGFVPVLIDLGSVVSPGNFVVTCTPGFALGAHLTKLTPEFDLNCIVTTLASCFFPDFEIKEERTRDQMKSELENVGPELALHASLCLEILNHESSVDAFAAIQSRVSHVYTPDATFE